MTTTTHNSTPATPPTEIDSAAPVVVRHSIHVAASPDALWALHTDVAGWPRWHGEITVLHADGPLAVGHDFTWTSYGFAVTSTPYAVGPLPGGGRRSLWGGTSDGITGVHEWRFTPESGGTLVETRESFAGQPIEANPDAMRRALDSSLEAWLQHLADAATADASATDADSATDAGAQR